MTNKKQSYILLQYFQLSSQHLSDLEQRLTFIEDEFSRKTILNVKIKSSALKKNKILKSNWIRKLYKAHQIIGDRSWIRTSDPHHVKVIL